MIMDKFMLGFLVGICFVLYLVIIIDTEIRTSKKIIPEWKLITDGKKIDTLYIYKQN